MDIRYSANQRDVKRYTTEELRNEFLITDLYKANEVVAVYSHVDRMVTLGCMPTTEKVSIDKGIDCWKNFGTHYFLERREIGIFNIGGEGTITADGQTFKMGYKDCLYITKGTKEVYFESTDAEKPAKFYMVSAPAHTSYTTTFIPIEKAAKRPCGEVRPPISVPQSTYKSPYGAHVYETAWCSIRCLALIRSCPWTAGRS